MPNKMSGKMERKSQADVSENLSGDTSRHTLNVKPGSVQAVGGGKISPNSNKRGKQG